MPKSKQMVRLLRDILKVREQNIPLAPARDVLGPDAHSVAAQRLRRALILWPRSPDFGPVAGITPALQVRSQSTLQACKQGALSVRRRCYGGPQENSTMQNAWAKYREIPQL